MSSGSFHGRHLLAVVILVTLTPTVGVWGQAEPDIIYAVVTKVPRERRQVTAYVVSGTGPVEERTLVAADLVLDNPVWKKLEKCHALRGEAWKTPEGYRLVSVKLLDAGMLPMSLQGLAGDCLLKKALEFAPQID